MQRPVIGTTALLILTILFAASGCSREESGSTLATSIKNPVAPTPKSLESGKRLYDRLCAECHGVNGDGSSEMARVLAESGKIPPSNLIDDTWDLGSTDGEIFMVIRDGSGSNLAMKGLNGKPGIVDEDMWNLVNYVRSLHK